MKYEFLEHQAKKLIENTLTESVGVIGKINPETVQQLTESATGKGKRKLIVQMEAIHIGRTANYTFYTEQGLVDGIKSWTHPYNKPVLTHHNSRSGEPIGRILRVEFSEATVSGRKGLIFTCEITDEEAIEKVLDGRYSTVSIGATTDKVTCNLCGTDRTKEWCEHWKGEEYDGQTCHYIIGTTNGIEVSYVNVPADQDAGNFSVSIDDGETTESSMEIYQIAEGLMQSVKMPEHNLYESASDDIRQLVDGLVKATEEGGKQMTVEEQLNAANVELTETKAQLTTATTQVAELTGKLSAAESTLATQVVENTRIAGQLTEAQADVDRLTQENAALAEKAHKDLAEKVVDMKIALCKADVVGKEKEAAVEEHVARSEDSLRDAIKDLQAEMANTTVQTGVVASPGATGKDNNPSEGKDEKEKLTVSEGIDMFKNMFNSKSNRK